MQWCRWVDATCPRYLSNWFPGDQALPQLPLAPTQQYLAEKLYTRLNWKSKQASIELKLTRFKTRLHSRKSGLVGMHLILLLPLFPFATYTNTATIRCEIFHFARRQNFRKDTINCRWCFGWGLSQHSGVPLPCLKWTLTIGCINTAQRPSLSPGPFIYSWAQYGCRRSGVCSGDTTPTNRLTRHESHLAAVEEHVPSQTHDKPVWLARKGRGRVFSPQIFYDSPSLFLPWDWGDEERKSWARLSSICSYMQLFRSFNYRSG